MTKINKLEIKNFKFFHEVEPLDFESKNILLYGENGSGKSTIYWALYTLLQSSKKDDSKIEKYFTHSTTAIPNNSSLVNIYANEDNAKIEIFSDETEDRFVISKNDITIKDTTIIEKSLYTSDFINYKYLFRFFNFLHQDEIDLFMLFEYEILHLLQLNEQWQEIVELKEGKPRVIADKTEYKDLRRKLNRFNEALSAKVLDLNAPTNRYLGKFDYSNIKITLTFTDGKYERKTFDSPQINIELKVIKSDGSEEIILRPQSYFNEAKLTAIALSVRLAITEIKLKDSPLKLLVLDDLLISLDMSNRDKVLDILLNDTVLSEYQKIILTHDRSFFEMAKMKLGNAHWKTFEMYVDNNGEFEKPHIKKSLNYFESAKKHFDEYDYPACANYLRKEVERIKKIVNQSDIDGIPVDRSMQIVKRLVNSDDFTNFSRPDTTDDACIGSIRGKLIGIKSNLDNAREPLVEISMQEINGILHRILHPQSHDDTSRPLYKKELEEATVVIQRIRDAIPPEGQ
jgi:ABC-type lipoprotein export system ATPase subunit